MDQICSAESVALVGLLAKAQIATSETAMGECVGRAAELEGNLEAISWDLFAAIGKFEDERRDAAQLILNETR